MMKNKVSVVLPAKGNCPYLIETLKSIEAGTLLPYEVLIVDDGISETVLNDIDNRFSQCNLKIIKNFGSGLVDALNTGLRLASGDLIARIDSDDLFTPYRLEIQIEFMRSNPEIVALGTNCIYINENGELTGFSNYPVGRLNDLRDFPKKCLLAHPSTIYSKEVSLEINGYRSIFRWNNVDIAEDFDFWLRMASKGLVKNMSEFLTKYRQHSKQLSSTNNFGQLLGTIYISVVNKAKDTNPPIINISTTDNSDMKKLIKYVLKNGGTLYTSVLLIRVLQFRFGKNPFMGKLINRICNRFCFYVINYI